MDTAVRLGVADAEAYAALRREMLLDAPWAFGSSPNDDGRSKVELLRVSLARPEHAIMAVRDAGGLVATAGVLREEKIKRRHIAMVWGVYVTPAARGRGLGGVVVRAAVEEARGWDGVACVQLSVSERAPAARRTYEKLGFCVWGEEPDALRTGDETGHAEVHMWLRL